ncbi:hypothetical protein HMF8227_02332 [Saliniradius amylolyticus]|uniref:Uncharacterized protein n=1 Tax=Saliniradius amylolyticus TaxID=2183582 RepID=A0A2S2E553_9ALTE|nr:hypothetical protein [Saliniradius amylolyticus]AWL12784.1 hypothetical protein HMF8227_02332 [Saliniradius amylolyticus]
MKVERSTTLKLNISELERLDPITVFLEDLGPNKGRITIRCFDQTWSANWNAMGAASVAHFFVRCDENYLCNSLSSIPARITADDDLVRRAIKQEIQRQREADLLDNDTAERMCAQVDEMTMECPNEALLREVFDYDWRYQLPEKDNPEYMYLCRIINAVQYALKVSVLSEEPVKEVRYG